MKPLIEVQAVQILFLLVKNISAVYENLLTIWAVFEI